MTAAEQVDAAEQRRAADLVKATATIAREQDARTYGVISFHLQAGRIVLAETKTTEKFTGA